MRVFDATVFAMATIVLRYALLRTPARGSEEKPMSFRYVKIDEAIQLDGLRMVVVGNIPSPWGEAAKGILHVKGIDWAAVRVDYTSESLKSWAGQRNGPIVIFNKERPRSGWSEILLLAERLANTPSLLPEDPSDRALMFGLSHELCGEGGLGWSRRMQAVHAGLTDQPGGFIKPVAQYLGKKYGYSPQAGEASGQRVADLLGMLSDRLHKQRDAGCSYYIGDSLTAVDIYSATFAAMFRPLPTDQCVMEPSTRTAFEFADTMTAAALDPILFEHRDSIYANYLELPLRL